MKWFHYQYVTIDQYENEAFQPNEKIPLGGEYI